MESPAGEFLTSADDNARELIATTDEAGGVWLGWLRHSPEGTSGEASLELRYSLGAEVVSATVTAGPALGPATVARAGRGVYLVWEQRTEDGRALFGQAVEHASGQLTFGPLEVLPRGPSQPLQPHLATLTDGSLGLVWQALDHDYYRAYFARRSPVGAWSAPRAVTPEQTADVWRPRLAAAPGGRVLVAYDRFTPGSTAGYDVLLATAETPDAEFRQTLVAGGPTYQGFPELGVDVSGRAWIAYEEAPSFGQGGALRARRQTRLAAVAPDGELFHAVLPRELLLEQRGDLPRLIVGANGVTLTRRLPRSDYKPRNLSRRPFYATWHTSVLGFDAAGVGFDVEVLESDGDNENDSVLLAGPAGLQLLLTTDRRSANFESRYSFNSPIENRWQVARFDLGPLAGFPRLAPGPPPPAPQAWSVPAPQGLALADRNPRALFGDLHRHTDLSRCAGRQDGTFLDAVRYARGPGALDFLAVTDHFQHLTPWSHARQLRDVERWDAPGSLALLPGYERMLVDLGHQNLVFDSIESQRAASLDLPPKQLPTGEFVAIPHMSSIPSNPFDWARLDADVQRLVEVHQGLRGSYEGLPPSRSMHKEGPLDRERGETIWPLAALDAGASVGWLTSLPAALAADAVPPGLISSSDHTSSGQAFAGIPLAPGASRELTHQAIFAALFERRTFATTGPAPGLRGPHHVSLAIEASGELVVRADGDGLVSITIVENGEPVELEAAGDTVDDPMHGNKERRLLVQTHFGLGRERRFTIRPEGLQLTQPVLRLADPELQDLEGPARDGTLVLDFSREQQADADVAFTVTPEPDVAPALTFELDDGEGRKLSLRFALEHLGPTEARRLYLGKLGMRPFLDLVSLGPKSTPRSITGGASSAEQELRWSLAGRPPGAIYYARVTWSDGNVAWSRMLR